ncbi:hypothetical protein [Salinispora arenicola]|uniref:hypothetical protein n=1 Tax=Salinispora arenicola TaxID=168697 RepID=UPI00036ED4F2|nr:hypothetical protein [Salinispora arenicola]
MILARRPPAAEGIQWKAVDVSTHRRAWKQRAGVVAALVVGALLTVPASPASAAPGVNNLSASPSRIEAGGTMTVSYSINISDGNPANVTVASSNGELTCVSGCSHNDVTRSQGFQASFRLASDAADGRATITVTAVDSEGEDTDDTTVTLVGKPEPQPTPPPTQAQTVKSVSGEVVNQSTGSAVPSALVVLKDSNGKKFDTMTDNGGNFRFTGSTQNPIAPGRIDIGASFENVYATKSFSASAGQSVSGQRISLAIKNETPSPTASSSIAPAPTVGAEEEVEQSIEAVVDTPTEAAGNEDSGGIGSLLIILLGGLLVAAGVGTIVLLWLRRKENDDEADEADGPPSTATGAVPVARGGYGGLDDHTRIVNPTAAAPTMVGGDPSLADAPTMMHRPVVDDVPPDPYGAPPNPYGTPAGQSGWAGSGYGDQPDAYGTGGFGATGPAEGGYGGAATPSSGSGYGGAATPSSGGGYGGDYGTPTSAGSGYPPASGGSYGYGERYNEATGHFHQEAATQYPAPADPYPTGRYQQDAGYSHPDPTYGQGGEPAGGYDQRGSYDDPGYGQHGGYGGGYGGYGQETPTPYGGYGQQPSTAYGSYSQQPPTQYGGYGQDLPTQRGGYDGYDQEAPGQHGGYDDRGYGQGGYGDPNQTERPRSDAPPPDRGGRRLDWLDD